MFLLILESLGSTELMFILVMALVFFGPRKLPQISRKLGKSLNDFRRASEDFKRTWDKEVTLEETGGNTSGNPYLVSESELVPATASNQTLQPPTIGVIAPDRVIARQTSGEPIDAEDSTPAQTEVVNDEPQHSPKSDWL